MESCVNLEKNNADRLQDDMDGGRRRYEQTLIIGHVKPRYTQPRDSHCGCRIKSGDSKIEAEAGRGPKRPRCTVSTPKSEC